MQSGTACGGGSGHAALLRRPNPTSRPAAADACVIEARILNGTSTGEHKVKLTGVIVSEVGGAPELQLELLHVDFNDQSGVAQFDWKGQHAPRARPPPAAAPAVVPVPAV